jgi:hypothetical protein
LKYYNGYFFSCLYLIVFDAKHKLNWFSCSFGLVRGLKVK